MDEGRPGLPTAVFLVAGSLLAWLIVAGWVAYATGRYAAMVLGACTVFTVVALGLPILIARIAKRGAVANGASKPGGRKSRLFETYTGPLSVRQAVIQILLAPAALAVGFTAIALIEILVRHSA